MKTSNSGRASILLFLAAMTTSSLTMLWLLWRFPVTTAVLAVVVVAGLGIAARLAKPLDTETISQIDHREPFA
jgi:hypothetical protein